MKKYLIVAGIILALCAVIYGLSKTVSSLKQELSTQTSNVEILMSDVKRYKYQDSLNVVEIGVLRLSEDQLKKSRAEDVKLIKELKMRPKDVQTITHTTVETRDSLVYVLSADSCFHYQDKWLKVDACLRDSNMTIVSTDSISQIVTAEYKHRFLWWRWKLKGFKQTVINHNPHSSIKYSEFIQLTK